MPGTSKRPLGWSLFPPAKDVPADVSIQNSSGRRALYNLQNAFHSTASVNDLESEFAESEARDTSCYRPSTKLGKASLERPDISAIGSKVLDRPNTATQARPSHEVSTPFTEVPLANTHLLPRSSSRPDHRESLSSRRDHQSAMSSSFAGSKSPSTSRSRSRDGNSSSSYQTNTTSLPALQQKTLDEHDQLEPLNEEELDPGSFDLVAPVETGPKQYSLETRSELLFSAEHLETIFNDPSLFLRFTSFLSSERSSSVPILLYYLDAIKALKALSYSNAIAEGLDPIPGFDFTTKSARPSENIDLEERASKAFEVMVRDDLPAYITYVYIHTVSISIQRRITGTLPPHLREASEGLAEVFCLTDPSRSDNPIVFASEEFHRTTQYGMSYVIGRNCRFLQGPKTNHFSAKRLREKIDQGKEHCEVFLNYRRDGSPFMNLLMIAPLCDSRGTIRYFIGAQVDVSGLVKECSGLESLKRLVILEHTDETNGAATEERDTSFIAKEEFQELSEMLNLEELETVRRRGGRMRQYSSEEAQDADSKARNWNKPRLLISSASPDGSITPGPTGGVSGRLSGIYENYLLVRPYPSLRILFASPSLRIPGILQSPFMAKIGGSGRVREELTKALADGRGVTAKVRWIASKADVDGRNRWIHCTPLLGSNGKIGVWMIVIADDEGPGASGRRYNPKVAPLVDPKFGRTVPFAPQEDSASLRDFARTSGAKDNSSRRGDSSHAGSNADDTERSGSPFTLRID